FYLDVLKDRLYTCPASSPARRSAQTALWHITHSLVRLMAPILSFTAEELWKEFSRQGDDSVFFHTWYALPEVPDAAPLLARWDRLREVRDPVRKQIEELRAAGKVGSSLQAEVELGAAGEERALLESLGEDLKYVFLTSAVRVGGDETRVRASAHPKCERCWHYRADVNGEGVCARCQSNLKGPGETRRYA
ncbi:MAG: class I tRNA ligase family protein, partial [Burkholderiales bacterium]